MTFKLDLSIDNHAVVIGAIALGVGAALGILKKFEVDFDSTLEAGGYDADLDFGFELEREHKKHKRGKHR